MEKNATIFARLIDLLDVMDARTTINIFVEKDGEQASIKFLKVYDFLSEPELMRKYKNYSVIGLTCDFSSTNILIKEA